MGSETTDVSMFLKVKDFTAYNNVFWVFQVRGSYIKGQICSAEPKVGVSVEVRPGAVPHGEVHIVIGSLSSFHPCDSLYPVHSERGICLVFTSVLLQGFVSGFPEGLCVLDEIKENRTVFGVGQS